MPSRKFTFAVWHSPAEDAQRVGVLRALIEQAIDDSWVDREVSAGLDPVGRGLYWRDLSTIRVCDSDWPGDCVKLALQPSATVSAACNGFATLVDQIRQSEALNVGDAAVCAMWPAIGQWGDIGDGIKKSSVAPPLASVVIATQVDKHIFDFNQFASEIANMSWQPVGDEHERAMITVADCFEYCDEAVTLWQASRKSRALHRALPLSKASTRHRM